MKTAVAIGIGAAAASGAAFYLTRNRSQVKHAAKSAKGAVQSATPHFKRDDADDATLADRVRSEIFRDHDAPKGDVSVDVQAGVVYLRGAVADAAWIERLGEEARKVQGITSVKNLLHAPGTPAPTAEPRSLAAEQHKH